MISKKDAFHWELMSSWWATLVPACCHSFLVPLLWRKINRRWKRYQYLYRTAVACGVIDENED